MGGPALDLGRGDGQWGESRSAWMGFLVGLKARGLKGVELAVSYDHARLD